MADEPLEGLTALLARMKGLPIRLQDKILSDWTTVTARRMAARLREVVRVKAFRSGRTLGSIRGARVRPAKARSMFGAIARAIAYASSNHGGALWSLLNRGTKERFARANRASNGRFLTGATGGAALASRGRGPRLNIVAQAAPSIEQAVMPAAEKDLAKRIERAWRKQAGE